MCGAEEIMAGLKLVRRSVEEIEKADQELIRQHHEYLASWIKQREAESAKSDNKKNKEVISCN
jgi:hypothetical protein